MIGVFICVGVAAAIIAEPFVERKMKKNRENYANEKRVNAESTEQREYRQRAEYNRAHLPCVEMPPLAPDWAAVDELVAVTYFRLMDEGDRYRYLDPSDNSKPKVILKSDFDGDTLKLIELLDKDVTWFYDNPTGENLWEQAEALKKFLRKKYSGLSDKSISRICSTYCVNNR